jgi:hypothetical protein
MYLLPSSLRDPPVLGGALPFYDLSSGMAHRLLDYASWPPPEKLCGPINEKGGRRR